MKYIDSEVLRKMVRAGAANLMAQQKSVDALNVFPVPDGDTGTNMSLTMEAAVREIEKEDCCQLGKLAKALAKGCLMGARGNSGVILSQIFRGLAQGLKEDRADGIQVAAALQLAVDTAYKGVIKPVEGTILTVIREAAKAAVEAARKGGDALEVWAEACCQGERTLSQTPDMLPVLKQAGVVDAGGKGLLVIMEGALAALKGEEIEFAGVVQQNGNSVTIPEIGDESGLIEFQYCTEFILKGASLPLEEMQNHLGQYGDSLLVVGEGEVAKIHVHSNHPGQVLEYCLQFGTLHQVEIHNMVEQSEERNRALANGETLSGEQKPFGIVAVGVGSGLNNLLTSLGVDQIVEGGQTLNPSTEELVNAINLVPAPKVLIFPNNKNIILAAQQAKELVEKEVFLLPTRSIPQGIAALVTVDPEKTAEENHSRMLEVIEEVHTGEVTYAIRDSSYQGGAIHAGDILGLADDEITVVGHDIAGVTEDLLAAMVEENHEIVTVYYGQEIDAARAEALVEQLRSRFPQLDFELHEGGQPLYYYVFSIE
ncbi:MAG: DAK2 domain-containing protein [Clostridia bacterium]|nr:DAK2 domain-containing protein [Clostridia bacterium]